MHARRTAFSDLPGPEVGGVRVSVVQRQEVVLLLDGEGQEHELDAAALLAHDHPGAVGPVGVAVGETRRLDAAVAALQRAAAGVDEACRGRQRGGVFVKLCTSEKDEVVNLDIGNDFSCKHLTQVKQHELWEAPFVMSQRAVTSLHQVNNTGRLAPPSEAICVF